MNKIALSSDSRYDIDRCVPGGNRNEAPRVGAERAEEKPQNASPDQSSTPLIQMSCAEQDGRYHDRSPNRESGSSKCGHRESAIQKLLATAGSNRQTQEGHSLRRGLREDPICHGPHSRRNFIERTSHAPKVHPVKCGENDRSDDACDNRTKHVRTSTQTQFHARVTMSPSPPPGDAHRDPLKPNRRQV